MEKVMETLNTMLQGVISLGQSHSTEALELIMLAARLTAAQNILVNFLWLVVTITLLRIMYKNFAKFNMIDGEWGEFAPFFYPAFALVSIFAGVSIYGFFEPIKWMAVYDGKFALAYEIYNKVMTVKK